MSVNVRFLYIGYEFLTCASGPPATSMCSSGLPMLPFEPLASEVAGALLAEAKARARLAFFLFDPILAAVAECIEVRTVAERAGR
jgi:hypothetical protein